MTRQLKRIYHLLIAVIANIRYGFPGRKLTVIGVTGTDGKTTTSTVLYEILKAAGMKVSMISTVQAKIAGVSYDTGFHVTTPDAMAVQSYLRKSVDAGDTHVVLEVTSHAIDQYRIWGIPFAVAVITNVTHEHLDYHRDFEDYLETKLKLLRMAGIVIANHDEEPVKNAVSRWKQKTVIWYGMNTKSEINPVEFPISFPLPGTYNQMNALGAMAAALTLGVPYGVAKKAIAGFSGVPGRMEVLQEKPFRVIVDFAHTPNAIDSVLQEVKHTTKKRLIHVFGSAGLRDHSKRPLMGKASATYSDAIIMTEEDYRTESLDEIMDDVMIGMPEKKRAGVLRIGDRGQAIDQALTMAKPGDTVIITGKGHETSLCRGATEYPWNDIVETKKRLVGYAKR
jgi:UDP-N-acetylmuramoyl-L-alanyl-D-glutamate--2,6-diaminopimelate ligase